MSEQSSYSSAAEEIKSRCNIVDVISPLVPLKKTGANYKGCCPFHKEKTPSFVVSETKQFYHCFGCGASGDVISFIQNYYNIPFTEAVEKLANQYGIQIELSNSGSSRKKEPYYDVNRKAARYFYDALTKKANAGYTYMKGRGIEPKTMQLFGMGFADAEWSSLTDALLKQGISREMLIELGLSSASAQGRIFDKYRSRVMFPIIDTKGKVIGFGGRIVGPGEPKYLNSQESAVFHKKDNLFGLNLTKEEIQKSGFAILVEGYMDVVGLYQEGVKNVAASLGTALTEQQARLIKRYTQKVVLCYDSDNAGIKAAFAGIDVLRAAGVEVKVLQVDDGKDPDEYIKKHGKNEFLELIDKKARTDIDYKIYILSQRYDISDTVQGIRFLEAAADVLRGLGPVEADIYTKKIAKDFGISEGALKNQVERKTASPPVFRNEEKEERAAEKIFDDSSILLEKTLLRLALFQTEYFVKLKEFPDAIISLPGSAIMQSMQNRYDPDSEFDEAEIREDLTDRDARYLDEIISEIPLNEKHSEAFEDCISRLSSKKAKLRQLEIENILSLEGEGDPEQLNALMKEYTELEKVIKGRR